MKKIITASLFLLTLMLGIFSGCKGSIDPAPKKNVYCVKGTLNLPDASAVPDAFEPSLNKKSRTAVPEFTFTGVIYKVTAVDENNENTVSIFTQEKDFTITLKHAGIWNITVEGFVGTTEADAIEANKCLKTEEAVSYNTDNNTSVTVDLSVITEGNGSVELEVQVQSYAVAASVNIVWEQGGIPVLVNIPFDASNLTKTWEADLPAGNYMVTFEFLKDSKVVYVCQQSVNVFANLKTNVWLSDGPCITGNKFILTATELNKAVMTDFYVDPTSDGIGLGTPYHPFKTLDSAYNAIISNNLEKASIYIKAGTNVEVDSTLLFNSENASQLTKFKIDAYCKTDANKTASITKEDSFLLFNFNVSGATFNISNLEITANSYSNTSSSSSDKLAVFDNGSKVKVSNCSVNFGASGSYATGFDIEDADVTFTNTTIVSSSSGNEQIAPVFVSNKGKLLFSDSKILKATGIDGYLNSPGISVCNSSENSICIQGLNTEISGFSKGICFYQNSATAAADYNYKMEGGYIKNNSEGISISGEGSVNPRIQISGGSISENKYGIKCNDSSNAPDLLISGGVIEGNENAGIDYSEVSAEVEIEIRNAAISDAILLGSDSLVLIMADIDAGKSYTIVPKTYSKGAQVVTVSDYLAGNYSKLKTSEANWKINSEGLLECNIVYYVSSSGSDENDGTTESTAFATISKVLEQVTDSEGDYTIKLCSDLSSVENTPDSSKAFIEIPETCSANSLVIESSENGTQRTLNAANKNLGYVIKAKVKNINTLNLTDLILTGANYQAFYVWGNSMDTNTVNISNCVIGSLGEIETLNSLNCANGATNVDDNRAAASFANVSVNASHVTIKNNYVSSVLRVDDSNLTLNDCDITNNYVGNSGNGFYKNLICTYGSYKNKNFSFNNVNITNNKFNISQNILLVSTDSKLNISGKINTENNGVNYSGAKIYLDYDQKINVVGKIEEGSNIYVLSRTKSGVITDGYNTYNTETDPSKYFKYENVAYKAVLTDDNEVYYKQGPTTFYISSSGDDSNDGLTEATAYKTFKKAKENCVAKFEYTFILCSDVTASNDDMEYISDTFGNAFVNLSNITCQSITIKSNDENQKRTIDAGSFGTVIYSYIYTLTLENLIITGGTKGIYAIYDSSSYLNITGCIIGKDVDDYPTESEYGNKGNYALFTGNRDVTITDCKFKNNYVESVIKTSGFSDFKMENTEISYNYSSDVTATGFIINKGLNGGQTPNLTLNNVVIHHNRADEENRYAVYLAYGTNIYFNGATVIKDNLSNGKQANFCLIDNNKDLFKIKPGLSSGTYTGLIEGSSIGISFDPNYVTTFPAAFTSGYRDVQGTVNPSTYFFADDSENYEIGWDNDSKEAVIKEKPLTANSIKLIEGTTNASNEVVYLVENNAISFDEDTKTYETALYNTNPYKLVVQVPKGQSVVVKLLQEYSKLIVLSKTTGTETITASLSKNESDGSYDIYELSGLKLYEKTYPAENSSKETTVQSIQIFLANHTEKDYEIKLSPADSFYVCGSDAQELSIPDGAKTLSGSKNYPFNTVQAAVDTFGSKVRTIYVDGTVIDTAGETSSESKNAIQISTGNTITIQGYKETKGGILKNEADDTRPLAIFNNSKVTLGPNLTITGGKVSTSSCGGGIFNGATLILNGCTITGNVVEGDDAMGGGIYCNQDSTTTVNSGTTISNNTAGKFGGGITVCGGTLTLEGGKFEGNSVTAEDGKGTAIQVKTYEKWEKDDSGNYKDSGKRKSSEFIIKGDEDLEFNDESIMLGYNTDQDSPEKIMIIQEFSKLTKKINVELDSKIDTGNQLIVKPEDLRTDVFSKFEIWENGKVSLDLYINDDGCLAEKTTSSTIGVNGDKNKVTLVEGISQTYFQKSDSGNTSLTITLTKAAGDAIYKLNQKQISCVIYNAETNTQSGQIQTAQVNYDATNEVYTATLSLNNFSNMDIGEYILVVSAESGNDSVIIESWTTLIWVVY